MPGPLTIGMTLGGLLCDLAAFQRKPRTGAVKASSLLSSRAGPRTRGKLRMIPEHDVLSVVGGPR
jgi:hypothetical protein